MPSPGIEVIRLDSRYCLQQAFGIRESAPGRRFSGYLQVWVWRNCLLDP